MKIWLIEGTDGTGKSTFSHELENALSGSEYLKFPSSTPTPVDKKSQTSRIIFHLNDFKTQLSYIDQTSCEHLVVDRCFLSTMVYQGFEADSAIPNRSFETILQLGSSLFHQAGNELVFIQLTCDNEEAVRRITNRTNGVQDDIENLRGEVLKEKISLLSRRYSHAVPQTMDYFRERYFYQPDLITIDNTDMTVEEEIKLVLP